MPMSLEAKMLLLASGDAALQSFLGVYPVKFRWFDRRLVPGYIGKGTCVVVRRVSTLSSYVQEGPLALEMVRMQLDAIDFSAETARAAARAIQSWFLKVDFMSDVQFQSPPGTPTQWPNFQLNQRSSIEKPETGDVYYVESQDWRVFNNSLV